MKRLLLFAVLFIAIPVLPQCTIKPLKPIPPLGCRDVRAVCQCDANGDHCEWVWICVKD